MERYQSFDVLIMKYLQVITGNKNKISEYKQYSEAAGVQLEFYANAIHIPEMQSSDIREVVSSKLDFVKNLTKAPFIVEDTGFTTQRYPYFPGTNTKFVNQTLGIEGWKRLFQEGDAIIATTLIALHYLGKTFFFEGRLDGIISFTNTNKDINQDAPLNSIFYVPSENGFLDELVKKGDFQNHRKKACAKLFEFIRKCEREERESFDHAAERWNKRADSWHHAINDESCYANHEKGYERFCAVIAKFLPLMSGEALDIGCGTGVTSRQLAEKNEINVLGIDISKQMIVCASNLEKTNLHFSTKSMDDLSDEKKFNVVISRGVVLSHLPHTAVFDFLMDITRHADTGAYLIFDFIQKLDNGNFPSVHELNEFSIQQIQEIMIELGWVHIYSEGTDKNRVRIVAFQKNDEHAVYFATGNPIKVEEFNSALRGRHTRRLYFYGVEVDEIKSDSLEKIVAEKLKRSYEVIQKPVICTDGGIFIEHLKGFPGENSKQAAQKLGAGGLLKLLDMVQDRRAIRRNCIGYYDGIELRTFTSEIKCEISNEMRGTYPAYEIDRILVPMSEQNPHRLTYAEMPIADRVMFTELPQLVTFIETML